jgi:transposase
MKEVTVVGLDLAKRGFQVHGATADGGVAFRKKLSRGQWLAFFSSLPSCSAVMEACATATTGHVRLMPLGMMSG